jgi:nucleoside-diphosphate-sugar epimerase
MRIFLTGATGFIGSRIVAELLGAGHSVLGLTRSDAGAAALTAAGAEPHRGDIEDLASLRAGAGGADAVIHTAFDHDFSNFVANCEKDRRVIETFGEVLKGSDRPLLITSGVGMGGGQPGQPATEDVFDRSHPNPRIASEEAGEVLKAAGVDVRVIRLPQVHDPVKQGLITWLVEITRQKSVSAYVGEGLSRWSAAHVLDVAELYRLALDRGQKNARYNAVAEEGVTARAIAEVLGEGLKVPVVSLSPDEVAAHFGPMTVFAGLDMFASSALTRQALGWTPKGPTLIEDLRAMDYGA